MATSSPTRYDTWARDAISNGGGGKAIDNLIRKMIEIRQLQINTKWQRRRVADARVLLVMDYPINSAIQLGPKNVRQHKKGKVFIENRG